jgi:hypothetical protein
MVTLDRLEYTPLEFYPQWEEEYKSLPYKRVDYGDLEQLHRWQQMGFTHTNYTGQMCSNQDLVFEWAHQIGELLGWKDIGYTFYKMETGDILPPHVDHFSKYKEMFDIKNSDDVMRCLVFLEDKKPGHMFEMNGKNVGDWMAGGAVAWRGRVEHCALNVGYEPRYTLQITGHA